MRLSLDAGWLHLAVTLGPVEPEQDGWRESSADALVERADPNPDRRSELDGRPVGFRGSSTPCACIEVEPGSATRAALWEQSPECPVHPLREDRP